MSHFFPVLLSAITRKRHDSIDSNATSQRLHSSTRRPGLDKILAVLSVLIMIVAFVLAMLCCEFSTCQTGSIFTRFANMSCSIRREQTKRRIYGALRYLYLERFTDRRKLEGRTGQ